MCNHWVARSTVRRAIANAQLIGCVHGPRTTLRSTTTDDHLGDGTPTTAGTRPTRFEQVVDLDATIESAWAALSDPDELARWLGSSVELDVRPGGRGRVVDDDGTVRDVLVTAVDDRQAIAWHWWSDDGELSSVELRIDECDGHARLHIVEMLVPGPHVDDAVVDRQVFAPLDGRDVSVVATRRRRRVRMSVGDRSRNGRSRTVDAGTVLAALADPTRRDVLAAVAARAGTATATELAAELPVTRQAITKHLTVLAEAGLVTSVRHGREARYQVVAGSLRPAADWIARTEAELGPPRRPPPAAPSPTADRRVRACPVPRVTGDHDLDQP